jgi:hypothetical protein
MQSSARLENSTPIGQEAGRLESAKVSRLSGLLASRLSSFELRKVETRWHF